MRGWRDAMAAALLTLAVPGGAQALQIVQTDPFAISGGVATVGFQEFDPALGTLDSIGVSITGTLSFTAILGPSQAVTPIFNWDAFGAGGRGFGFAGSGAVLLFPPLVNPSPTAPLLTTGASNFSLSFTLTATTDVSGVIVPSVSAAPASIVPPVTVEAQRSDFIAGLVQVGITESFVFAPVSFAPTDISGGGVVTFTYDYTPAAIAVPAAPAGAALLAGLAIAGLLRRRG